MNKYSIIFDNTLWKSFSIFKKCIAFILLPFLVMDALRHLKAMKKMNEGNEYGRRKNIRSGRIYDRFS